MRDTIVKWLIEEDFIVSKLDVPPGAEVAWCISVSTPGVPTTRFTVLSPAGRSDKIILAMVVTISPEHRSELERLKPAERVKVIHSILSKALAVCMDCKIGVQPNILNPQNIAINADVYEEEVSRYGKPYFMRLVARFLNTYFTIVSGFNEWFPVIPPSAKEREGTMFI